MQIQISLQSDSQVVAELSDQRLLETIHAIESVYKPVNHATDHRRHLSRGELERVLELVRHRALLRTSGA